MFIFHPNKPHFALRLLNLIAVRVLYAHLNWYGPSMSRCLFDPKPTPMAPPCRAPDGQLQRSNSRTGGGFAEKYTWAPSMQRLEGGKGPEGGLHYQDIWTVVSVKCRHRTRGEDQSSKGHSPATAGWNATGGEGRGGIRMPPRVTRANLLCCQGCIGQVLDWDGWGLFDLPSLRQILGPPHHLWADETLDGGPRLSLPSPSQARGIVKGGDDIKFVAKRRAFFATL